jgi:hypothetical protein
MICRLPKQCATVLTGHILQQPPVIASFYPKNRRIPLTIASIGIDKQWKAYRMPKKACKLYQQLYVPADIAHFPVDVAHFPVNIEHFPANIKHFPANIKHFPANIEHFPVNIEHFPVNIEHFPVNAGCFSLDSGPLSAGEQGACGRRAGRGAGKVFSQSF